MLGCLLLFQERGSAAAEVSRELRIRAALLQWIPFYVEWPPAAFPTKDGPLLIGILGPDPFRNALESLLDKKVDGHEVKVVRFDSLENLRDCHILYVNLPERKDVQRALEMVRGKPILTVSDQETFTDQGGMIGLLKYKNHIKPHINNAAARRAGLVIQSSLLTVSEITNP
ncbi:MAG: YfiR family protein [Verrucomicrobia bacterium]|nr:YfiR family protein [Verrucomicrobiota bacterium]